MPLALKAAEPRAGLQPQGRAILEPHQGRIVAEHGARKAETRGGLACSKLVVVLDISAQAGIRHANRALG
jgi:hypothetical protein